jgi:DNA-binding transcriptional LysR family regulator
MRAIELRQLRYFLLLAKELHFGRAAELAFVTQPALSQQIAKLEALIGVQLLIRDRRHVTLTPAGISLRDDAQALFEQLDQTLRRARAATTDQEFRISIGMVEYTNLPFVPPALMRLQQLYPDLKVERHEMNGAAQIAALPKRQIDIGFGVPVVPVTPNGSVTGQPLLVSGYMLAMRSTHRLAGVERLRIDDLAGERIVIFARTVNPPLYDSIVAHCRSAGFTPNFVYETMQLQVGITLVAQGLGVLLGAEYVFSALPSELVCKPIDGFDELTVHLFTRAEESNPLILDFVEIAAEEAIRVQLHLAAMAGRCVEPE